VEQNNGFNDQPTFVRIAWQSFLHWGKVPWRLGFKSDMRMADDVILWAISRASVQVCDFVWEKMDKHEKEKLAPEK
jgi:hypothetical protein